MSRQIVFGTRALSLREHAQRPSNIGVVDFFLRPAVHLLELDEPGSLFFLWNVIVKLCCRGSRASGVFEDVETVVLTFSNQLDGLLEVLISLTWKADNDVARQSEAPARILDTLNPLDVITSFVTPAHQFENTIASRLYRQMNPVAKIGIFFDG